MMDRETTESRNQSEPSENTMMTRQFDLIDRVLIGFDQATRTVFGQPRTTGRPNPGVSQPEANLSDSERTQIGRLMRINHTGEVCAQALYHGQAATAQHEQVRERMARSAQEESDHLDWCASRLDELGNRKSLLNPLWYAGSYAMGALAGIAGDKWSLGFVAETERQVESHLDGHLERIPLEDTRTRAIVEQMKADEIHHAETARAAGGVTLPNPIRRAMKATAKIMTSTVYWI